MLERLLGSSPQYVSLTPLKGKTLVSMHNMGVTAERLLPVVLAGLDSSWNFPFPLLSTALANRKTSTPKVEDGTLILRDPGSSYLAKIVGVEATQVPRVEVPKENFSELHVDSDTALLVRDGLKKVHLNKTLAALPDLTVHISLSKRSATLIAFDRSQMACAILPNNSGQSFEASLPLSRAESLFRDYLGETLIRVSPGLVYSQVDGYKLSISLPAEDDPAGVPLDRVLQKAKELKQADLSTSVVLKRKEFEDFLGNTRVLSKNAHSLSFKISKAASQISLDTDGNKIEATIPCKASKTFHFSMDTGYVASILDKSKGNIQLHIDESTVVLKTEELIYASVLSANKDKSDESGEVTAKRRKAPHAGESASDDE